MKQISPEQRTHFLKSLHPIVESYEPAPAIQRQAYGRSILVLSGASGCGKDTIIDHAGIGRVQSRTTRPQRHHINEQPGNGYSHFYDIYQPFGRWEVRRDLGGLMVQAEVFPTDDIYGSRIEDYPEKRGVLNATARTFSRLKRSNLFRHICQAYIISPTPERWIDQLNRRDGPDSPDRAQRIQEALSSVTTALQTPDITFIINDTVPVAAEQLTAYLDGRTLPESVQREGREAAIQLKIAIEEGSIARTPQHPGDVAA